MQPIATQRKIDPFIVFFVIPSTQIGVGMLGFQNRVAKSAGYDAWISMLLVGIITHIVMFLMYKMLKGEGTDLVAIHQQVFGKWLGGVFNLLFAAYACFALLTVTRSYIELVQVWMFPDLSTFLFTLFFFGLVFYIINGGFRVIAGISFFSIVLPFFLVFVFLFVLPFSDFGNLLPVLDHSAKEILQATKDLMVPVYGYEMILVFYPFIKQGQSSQKWAHFGLLFTTLIYVYIMVLSFAFFSEEQLRETIWPTLSILKMIEFPFLERFEYIGVISWHLIILPNVCIYLWCASRLLKQTVKIQQRKSAFGLLLILLFLIPQIETRYQVDMLDDYAGNMSLIVNYLYIPLLFVLLSIVKKVRNRR
jgi:spore germination protein (amino acid permease)